MTGRTGKKTQHNGDVEIVTFDGISDIHITGMATEMAEAIGKIVGALLDQQAAAELDRKPVTIRARAKGLALTIVARRDTTPPTTEGEN
jgi:hypothetical protein